MNENVHPQVGGDPVNPLAELGALVRTRREERRLSMDQLARMAGIGRSTLFRFEVGKDTTTAPSRIAKVLVVLQIGADEVIPLVDDEELLTELLAWLDRASQVQELSSYVQAKRPAFGSESGRPDLVAIHPDGTMLYIEVKAQGTDADEDRRGEDLVRVLASIGYLVTRPANTGVSE